MSDRKLLLHVCCANCLNDVYEELAGEFGVVTGFFYNPNIHPLIEFRRRLKSVKVLAGAKNLDVRCDERYGLQEFLRGVVYRERERCSYCYYDRLLKTARLAKELGFERFGSTLMVSAHQDHQLLQATGDKVATETGVPFYYRDLMALQGTSRLSGITLYHQTYCGCVYSEYDRYKDSAQHLYKQGNVEQRIPT